MGKPTSGVKNSLEDLKISRCRTEEEGEVLPDHQVATYVTEVLIRPFTETGNSGRDKQVLRGMAMSSVLGMSGWRMAMDVQ